MPVRVRPFERHAWSPGEHLRRDDFTLRILADWGKTVLIVPPDE